MNELNKFYQSLMQDVVAIQSGDDDGRRHPPVGRIRRRAEPRQRSAAHKTCADGFVVKLEYPGLWNIVIM